MITAFDSIPYSKVTVRELELLGAQRKPEKKSFVHLRKGDDPQHLKLSQEAAQWIRALPGEFRPLALAKRYARIANILARLWPTPLKFEDKLAEYLLDDRGTRQGFPSDVLVDLINLKKYYQTTRKPMKKDLWELV